MEVDMDDEVTHEELYGCFLEEKRGDFYLWTSFPNVDRSSLCREMFSTLELAIMFDDLDAVERAYLYRPQELSWYLLRLACEYGAAPGVVGFLAQQIPEQVSYKDQFGRCLLHYAMQRGPMLHSPSSDDILQLVETFPDAVEMIDPERKRRLCTPLDYCLHFDFSTDVVEGLFAKAFRAATSNELVVDGHLMSDSNCDCLSEGGDVRRKLDESCVAGFVKAMPRIKEVSIYLDEWQEEAFVHFLRVLLESETLTSLDLSIPDLLESEASSQVEGIVAAQVKPVLPALQSLTLRLKRDVDVVVPLLCRLLSNTRLHKLYVDASSLTWWSFEPTGWCDVLDILEDNQHLRHLYLFLDVSLSDSYGEQWLRIFENHLLKIIQVNTSLHKARIGPGGLTSVGEEIDVLAASNQYGRGAVKDSGTSLKEFVDLLCAVRVYDDSEIQKRLRCNPDWCGTYWSERCAFLWQYELLKASPGLWSDCSSDDSAKACKKRKRCQESA